MMTLDSIRNVEFSRGRGYRADEVDDFIDACVETVETLQRENETLNQKMKVLADKLVEYRNEEDSIRAALLSAQRTGDIIIREAKDQAEQILQEAQEKARRAREDCQGAITDEQKELDRVQREVAAFKARMLSLYKEHLALINVLPEVKEAPAAAEEEPVTAAEPVTPAEDVVVAPEAASADEAPAEETMKSVSRFSNLKFGADYNISDDDDEDDEDDKKAHNPFRRKK